MNTVSESSKLDALGLASIATRRGDAAWTAEFDAFLLQTKKEKHFWKCTPRN